MIDHLHIKNVALIECAEITFASGLNILSGETGAGKSMLIDALNFVLGERPSKDFIRTGEQSAQVDVLVTIAHNSIGEKIGEKIAEIVGLDFATEQAQKQFDEQLLISRTINLEGRSVCKLNGKTITISMLKEVSNLLVDVHGQHEHQSLLNSNKHIVLLDQFCGEEIAENKALLGEKIVVYKEIVKQVNALSGNEKDREASISLLNFQKSEIQNAKLSVGEEEKLLERRKILSNIEHIMGDCFSVLANLSEQEGEQIPALTQISKSIGLLNSISEIDKTLLPLCEFAENSMLQLSEIVGELKKYTLDYEQDSTELDEVELRLDQIYMLKKKYGGSIEAVLQHLENVTQQLEIIENSDELLEKLSAKKKVCTKEIMNICANISNLRKQQAKIVGLHIVEVLQQLGIKDAQFEISIEQKKEFSANGYDKVEFLISPNVGETLKPLAKIASGGEMSRVMLALKTVLADVDNIETFIFDEIDAGVSGRTAQKVGEKLALIGKNHQILCITHLPQIASMGDCHFLIEKVSDANKTTTHVSQLNESQTVVELARLIGGAKITEATMVAATEMKQMANTIKKQEALI